MFKIERSKSGNNIIKYNNKYLNSKYDPIKESKTFIDDREHLMTSNIVIYGVGSGYHIREVLKRTTKSNIYVFEYNMELFTCFKSFNKDIIEEEKVTFITKDNKKFLNILREKINLVEDIIVHRPSLETIKLKEYSLYTILTDYEKEKININRNKHILIENFNSNKKLEFKNLIDLIKKINHDNWIITSGGPSLDYVIDDIKKLKEYKIIATGTTLRTLIKNGITPEIVVIIDAMEGVREQLRGMENLKIPLCFLSTASREAVSAYNGPKYIFYNEKNETDIIIETGKTVAVAALNIVIKLGAKKVIFVGQDLGYINGKSHLNLFQEMYDKEDKIVIEKNKPKVKSVTGEYIDTTEGYLYFKKQIENIIECNKHINFINCSKGAIIRGCSNIDIKLI